MGGSMGLRRRASTNAGGPCSATARNALPSNRYSTPNVALQIRVAFANIVSNTGCRLPGELEMTFNTSAVAVGCSSDSASFFFRSALAARRRATSVLAFVVFERRPVMRVRLFAPLRAKITSSARSLGLPILAHDELASSLDHLVGAREQGRWNGNTNSPCGLKIDDQFELGRLDDGQLAGFFAFQHAAGVDTSLPISI